MQLPYSDDLEVQYLNWLFDNIWDHYAKTIIPFDRPTLGNYDVYYCKMI